MQTLDYAPETMPRLKSSAYDRQEDGLPLAFSSKEAALDAPRPGPALPRIPAGELRLSPGQPAASVTIPQAMPVRPLRQVRVDWYALAVILLVVSCAVFAVARLVWAVQP